MTSSSHPPDDRPPRTWRKKFGDAGRGVVQGIRGQNSFAVHLTMALAVIVAGVVFQLSLLEWCLVLLCITWVITCELFNSSLEFLAQAIDRRHNPWVGRALDVASGAVLMASIGAAVVGALIFLSHAVGSS